MFQYFLANSYNKHFIMSAQHGCAYGMDKRHEGEVFEKSISQNFSHTDGQNLVKQNPYQCRK